MYFVLQDRQDPYQNYNHIVYNYYNYLNHFYQLKIHHEIVIVQLNIHEMNLQIFVFLHYQDKYN